MYCYKALKSGKIDIKCSPYAGSNKAYAAFDSSRVLSVDEAITFPCEYRKKPDV